MTVTDETIVLRTFADAKDAYRAKDLRQVARTTRARS